jgi:hypothetical protein
MGVDVTVMVFWTEAFVLFEGTGDLLDMPIFSCEGELEYHLTRLKWSYLPV